MRLTLATLLMMAAAPAWAGDPLVGDAPAAEAAPGGAAAAAPGPAVPATGAGTTPYAGLYDAPLFGRAIPAAEVVDETALRFYAAQRNRARVDAEIRRLRALHPAWKVPANLYAAGAGGDEQPLWDLFSAGRTEELRFAIQAREKREAGWRPSADLLLKMTRAETAAQLRALSDAKDWTRLLAVAAAHPEALSCAAVDLVWRVADAFAALGSPGRAYEVDAAVLKSCRNRDERLATVRKAAGALPVADVERLIAAGAVLADGSGEFDDVRLDLARREIGRALSAPAREGAPVGDVSPAGLDALGAATLRSGDAPDAALLGWYAYRRARWAEADGWFRLGMPSSNGDAKMAEGHALALKELGRLDEAADLAHAWRERSGVMRGLFVALTTARLGAVDVAPSDPAVMADFTAILEADRSVEAAGALGWTAYARGDVAGAAQWFGRALDWSGSGEPPEKVVEGYGLALMRLGRLEAAEDVLYPRRDRSAAARDLYVAVAISALSAGAAPGSMGPDLPAVDVTPERMDRFAEAIRAARSGPGAAALGWRSLRDGRPAAAVDWFDEAAAWSPEPVEAGVVEGRVLALKDSGRLAEAEDAAYGRIRDSARLREAYRGIMAAQLATPSLAGRLTPDRVARFAALAEAESSAAGAEALGWYHLDRDRCGYAVEWFRRAVAWSPDRRGTAKANEGLARALGRAGRDLEADDVAATWSDRSADMRALDIELVSEGLTRDLFPATVDEDRLARFSELVRAEHSAAGAQALGWHRYRDAGAGYGVEWFADAIRWSPDRRADPKTVEGYASALRDVGRLAEAEEVLHPWVGKVSVMRDLYIDTVVSELTLDDPPEPMPDDRLARFLAVATPLRSAAAAQAIGWYRFARREYAEAAVWFKRAVDWWPELPPYADRYAYVPEGFRPVLAHLALGAEDYRRTPRAFTSRAHGPEASQHRYVGTFGGLATTWTGYALSLDAIGRTAEAEDIAYAWRDRWPALGRQFVDIAVRTLTREGGGCGSAGAPVEASRLKRYAAVIEERRDAGGAAALGWAAAARHDPDEAAVWLKVAIEWRPADAVPDGRVMAGYVDALRGSGRPEEAFAAAAAWAGRVPEVRGRLLDAALDLLSAVGSGAGGAGGASTPVSAGSLARAVALAEADGSARGPLALGWFHLAAKRPDAALAAFRTAVTRAGEASRPDAPGPAAAPGPAEACAAPAHDGDADALPKAVEGFALALRAAGRDADALAFVEAWAAKMPALAPVAGGMVADVLARDGARGAVAPAMLDRMAALTLRTRSVPAAAAFGWYGYGRRDWGRAADWFADGIAWSPEGRGPVKLVEGYAASLRNACRFAEAERASLSRPEDDGDGRLRTLYVDAVAERVSRMRAGAALEPADASRFAAATVATSSPNGAQALGWYAYRSRQFAAAAAWFEKAVAWRAAETDVYGLALSERRLGDAAALGRVLGLYEARFPALGAVRRAGIGGREPPVPDFGGRAPRDCDGGAAGDPSDVTGSVEPSRPIRERPAAASAAVVGQGPRRPSRVVAGTSRAAPAEDHPPCPSTPTAARTAGDREAEGWCLLALQRPAEAAEAFRAAGAGASGRVAGDSALGEALSHLRQDDAAAAVVGAGRAPIAADKRRDLGLQILSEQAYAAYREGRWAEAIEHLRRRSASAAEPRDLTMLRGWSLYHEGDVEGARRAFAEADRLLSDRDSRNALATVDAVTTNKAFR